MEDAPQELESPQETPGEDPIVSSMVDALKERGWRVFEPGAKSNGEARLDELEAQQAKLAEALLDVIRGEVDALIGAAIEREFEDQQVSQDDFIDLKDTVEGLQQHTHDLGYDSRVEISGSTGRADY